MGEGREGDRIGEGRKERDGMKIQKKWFVSELQQALNTVIVVTCRSCLFAKQSDCHTLLLEFQRRCHCCHVCSEGVGASSGACQHRQWLWPRFLPSSLLQNGSISVWFICTP